MSYYYLSGGNVEIGETAEDVIFKKKQELEMDLSIIRPLWLNQAFFS